MTDLGDGTSTLPDGHPPQGLHSWGMVRPVPTDLQPPDLAPNRQHRVGNHLPPPSSAPRPLTCIPACPTWRLRCDMAHLHAPGKLFVFSRQGERKKKKRCAVPLTDVVTGLQSASM